MIARSAHSSSCFYCFYSSTEYLYNPGRSLLAMPILVFSPIRSNLLA